MSRKPDPEEYAAECAGKSMAGPPAVSRMPSGSCGLICASCKVATLVKTPATAPDAASECLQLGFLELPPRRATGRGEAPLHRFRYGRFDYA